MLTYIGLNKLIPNDFIPEGRKHHAGTAIGKYIVFHGGSNTSGHILNDMIMFDIAECKWINVKIGISDEELLINRCSYQK